MVIEAVRVGRLEVSPEPFAPGEREDFVDEAQVPRLQHGDGGGRDAALPGGTESADRATEGALAADQIVGRLGPVDADHQHVEPGRDLFQEALVEPPVGVQGGHAAALAGVPDQGTQVVAEERFAPAEGSPHHAGVGELVDRPPEFVGAHLVGGGLRDVTVRAAEVAAVSEDEGDGERAGPTADPRGGEPEAAGPRASARLRRASVAVWTACSAISAFCRIYR